MASFDLPPVHDSSKSNNLIGRVSGGYNNPAFESDNNVSLRNFQRLNTPDTNVDQTKKSIIMDPEKLRLSDNKEKSLTEKSGDKKQTPAVEPVPFLTLFRFADWRDKLYIFLGCVFSIANGVCVPLMVLVFGDVTEAFSKNDLENVLNSTWSCSFSGAEFGLDTSGNAARTDIVTEMRKYALYFVGIGLAVTFCGWAQVTFWMLAAENQCYKMRIAFFRSVMYQSISWFDQRQSGELNSRLSDDIAKIQAGIGDKVGIALQWMVVGLASFIMGFVKGWQLSLVILSLCPLIGLGAFIMTKIVASLSNTESGAYAKAGAVAEEVLSNIRTVVAYGGEKKEAVRYGSNLNAALKAGVKKSFIAGMGMGFTFLVMFSAYCLGFWYGAKLIRDSESDWLGPCLTALKTCDWQNATVCVKHQEATYTPGVLVTVFFSIIFGAFGLGQSFPNLALLATARGLARTIFDIIDHVSDIDASKEIGDIIQDSKSLDVSFSGVKFSYPTRSDVEVLRGLDLHVKVGESLALVGKSGCGKSTVVQLIQRFYDPSEGTVLMGENKLSSLNVRWLREQIGVVSQEPVLFATTIAENIRYGRPDVTQEEIERAAKEANAHDFIKTLPQKYDTLVGDRGAQLSGGQKQRVAIARALVRNPKILLLDEATSALDTESESVVQEALDKARLGRTTIIIAHRLSTIQNADRIAVIKEGRVIEIGNHTSLMDTQGIYHRMVQAQHLGEEEEEEDEIQTVLTERKKQSVTRQRTLSITSVQSGKLKTEEEEKKNAPEVGLGRIIKMNSPEWFYILLGCLAAGLNGSIQPLFAIVFAQILNIFTETDLKKQAEEALYYSLGFLLIGVLTFVVNVVQALMFGISGEKLTERLRRLSFEAMLRQEIGWFDDPHNGTGTLTTRLASETSLVNGATGIRLGVMMQALGSMGVGLVLAFFYGWKMSLVILAFVPFIVIAGAAQTKLMVGFSADVQKRLIDGGKVATEAIDNIRTVASLGREKEFCNAYQSKLKPAHEKETKKAIIYGAAFGVSQGIVYYTYAAAFYFGATQVQSGEMTFNQVMKVVGCIIFSAMAVGQAASFAPDYGKAKVAANEIFALLDRQPAIDHSSTGGQKLENVAGQVSFDDVHFRYPSRPDVPVLQGLSVRVTAGQTLALVGASGCGKSTCIQLLERFYDTQSGKVALENVELKSLSVSWLRSQFGLVSQEPALFDCTISENIAYGDNSRVVPMNEIIDAARRANIHEFIVSLPQGYDTRVGEKGGQLSGGQKQRIAIARALVREPKILLLDEATSALDSESEKVVQEALDAARLKRTCIAIAHRLSTIQNADAIAVIHAGRVAEYGTHTELLSQQGLYFRLCKAQSRL